MTFMCPGSCFFFLSGVDSKEMPAAFQHRSLSGCPLQGFILPQHFSQHFRRSLVSVGSKKAQRARILNRGPRPRPEDIMVLLIDVVLFTLEAVLRDEGWQGATSKLRIFVDV